MKSRKLVLVNPVNAARTGLSINRSSRFPPLGLGIVAALTPESWEVELVDENFEPFSYREADLVGITSFTSSVNRAYEIAALYKQNRVPVVMGGVHVSTCTSEALGFADSVVVGEAETVWSTVLADAAEGKLQPIYRGEWEDSTDLKPARRELYHADYMFASIQTSRGCPLDCDFCSVTAYNGRRYRRRPPSQVLDEIETIPQKLLFFVDDNVIGYGKESRDKALEIFKGMVDRGLEKQWVCQASVNIADDEEILDWAARAGCRMVFLGLEAEDSTALAEVNKRLNMKIGSSAYDRIFDRIHQAGIAVLGAFIFGMDGDTPAKLRHRTDFIIDSDVDVTQATVLTPLPGTRLYDRLEQQGRLRYTDFPRDWDRYNLIEVVHQPNGMEPDELSQVLRECIRRMCDLKVVKRKVKRALKTTGSWEAAEFVWQTSLNYRNVGLAESTFASHGDGSQVGSLDESIAPR